MHHLLDGFHPRAACTQPNLKARFLRASYRWGPLLRRLYRADRVAHNGRPYQVDLVGSLPTHFSVLLRSRVSADSFAPDRTRCSHMGMNRPVLLFRCSGYDAWFVLAKGELFPRSDCHVSCRDPTYSTHRARVPREGVFSKHVTLAMCYHTE